MANEKCLCDHCKSRYSWDCDDGLAYPRGGCDEFSLDWDTLSGKQQKAIRKILSHNTYDEPNRCYDWED